jgi:hypothetical protein
MPKYDTGRNPPAPLAEVTLRIPADRSTLPGVLMLLDTGADATLLPREALARIGAKPAEVPPMELESFDGSRSTAELVDVALEFAGKSFEGLYPVIDGDEGVLGRDVLNHLAVVFDGPDLTWTIAVTKS